MKGRPLRREGGIYRTLARNVLGELPQLPPVELSRFSPDLVDEARAAWRERFASEYRSVQIFTRFLEEVTGAGDPLEVQAAVLDAVRDEMRHVALCAAACRALGTEALLPEPVALRESPAFLAGSMPERALTTALSMLVVNETVSVGFIEDLRARCTAPSLRMVLDETLSDEDGHRDFGWTYVRDSMQRFPHAALASWRKVVEHALAPHLRRASELLSALPPGRRTLEAWPDDDRAPLALFSPQRQALVFERTVRETLWPRLRALELVSGEPALG